MFIAAATGHTQAVYHIYVFTDDVVVKVGSLGVTNKHTNRKLFVGTSRGPNIIGLCEWFVWS